MTRTKLKKKCSLTNPSCICSFIDSYTLCAVGRCSGHDRAAAIRAPISFFVPESMLVSDDDFEAICLHGENIVETSDSKGEKDESENTIKSSTSSTARVFEGDGVVISLNRNGRIIAKVEDEEPVQIKSHFVQNVQKRKGGHSSGGRSSSGHPRSGSGNSSVANSRAGPYANREENNRNNALSSRKLVGSWHTIFWIGFVFIVFVLL